MQSARRATARASALRSTHERASYVALIADGRFAERTRSPVSRTPSPPSAVASARTSARPTARARGRAADRIAGLKRFVTDFAAAMCHCLRRPRSSSRRRSPSWAPDQRSYRRRDLALLVTRRPSSRASPNPEACCASASRVRLPKAALQQDIDRILALGVDLRCDKTAGKHFTVDDLLDKDGYKAVYLAVGLQGGRTLPIPAPTPRASSTPSTCLGPPRSARRST